MQLSRQAFRSSKGVLPSESDQNFDGGAVYPFERKCAPIVRYRDERGRVELKDLRELEFSTVLVALVFTLRSHLKTLLLVIALLILGSYGLDLVPLTPEPNYTVVAAPMAGFSDTVANAYSATVDTNGNAPIPARWSTVSTGLGHGVFTTSGNTSTYTRVVNDGPCDSGTPLPNCQFTFGSPTAGNYGSVDDNYFPNAGGLSQTFFSLRSVEVTIHHELLTNDLSGGFSDCGLSIGFGSAAGHANASLASNNLKVGARTGNRDLVRILHRIKSAGAESVELEAPMNTETDSGNSPYGTSSWNTSFNMTEDSPLSASGDYVDFKLSILLDHTAHTAILNFTPVATNKTLSAFHSQTISWPYTAALSNTVGGEARGGIVVGSGTQTITMAQLLAARSSIGFTQNGVSKSCGFSNVKLTLFK